MGDTSSVEVEEIDNIKVYTLRRRLLEAKITEWGATIMSLSVPDSKGNVEDVVLGFDTLVPYMDGKSSPYFGAIVGRVANRIGGASFILNGKTYNLPANDGANTLHGGHVGFDKVLWRSHERHDKEGPSVQFNYHSYDGEQGFPGNLEVAVTYTLSSGSQILVEMEASPRKKATPVSLANHTYWNLSGHGSGDILGHKVRIWGSHITPVNDDFIPTGRLLAVSGTPFDFSKETSIGSRISEVPGPAPGGYDHNYVLDYAYEHYKRAARVVDPASGRVLEVLTDAPGMQFYTGNFIDHIVGKGGAEYKKHGAFCLETQGFPNAVNQKEFPSVIVQPGEVYKHNIVYNFFTVTPHQS